MSVGRELRQLYDTAIYESVRGTEQWMQVCKLTGQLYRYEFENILMIYIQRPDAALVADYGKWKEVGRYVKRGSKGIAVFPSRALKPKINYVFDISDTGGKNRDLTWVLDGETRDSYASYLKRESGEPEPDAKDGRIKESAIDFLKSFTENRIGVIMDLEFGERIAGLADIAGTKMIMVDDETQEITAEEAVKRSVIYTVFTRCGFALPPEKQDFSFITGFTLEKEIYCLGSLVSDISCEVLRNIAKELKQMTERSIAYGRNGIDVPYGNGRDAVSQPENAGGRNIHSGPGQIRGEGDGIPKENHKSRYRMLARFRMLAEKMEEVQEEADRMMEILEKKYLENNPLQNSDSTMEMWNLREQARRLAEEIVMAGIVMKYH